MGSVGSVRFHKKIIKDEKAERVTNERNKGWGKKEGGSLSATLGVFV
jgi:hypothetical protein